MLTLNGTHSSSSNFDTTEQFGGQHQWDGNQSGGAQIIVQFFASGTSSVNVAGTLNILASNTEIIGQESGTGSLSILPGGVVNVVNGATSDRQHELLFTRGHLKHGCPAVS